MRVGVVGASGFIGSHLIAGLSPFHSLSGFSSSIADKNKNIHKGDYFNPEEIQFFCNNLDTLIYVAGMVNPRFSSNEKLERAIDQQITQLDLWLRSFFAASPEGKFICFSSSGALHPKSFEKIYDENDLLEPQGSYGILKFREEDLILKKYHQKNIIILRPSNVYGDPYKKNTLTGIIDRLIHASIHGEVLNIFDHQSNVRDYLYIEDVVEAVNTILKHQYFSINNGVQVFNLSSQTSLDLEELISCVRKHFGDMKLVYSNQDKEKNALYISSEKFRNLTGWSIKISFEDSLISIKRRLFEIN